MTERGIWDKMETLKSFWKRPEGKTGGIFMAGIVIGGSILLYKLLPYIITLLKNGITASILAVVLGAIVYVILDPKFRNLVWFLYKSIMRTVTSLFIQIDPVGIMKTYIDSLRKNLSMMNEQITTLKGQIRNLQEIITNNNEEKENNIQLAKQAQKTGNKNQVILKTRKAGRLDNSNFKLEDLSKKMEILYRVLNKMHENAGLLLEDIVDEVKVREKERAAIKVSHSAMKSAMNIISGDPDKKLMFEQAMEVVVDDIGRKLREMERFMEVERRDLMFH